MKLLREALTDGNCLLDLDAHDLPTVFRETVAHLVSKGTVEAQRSGEVEAALIGREQVGSTAIGHAVAIPHVYLDSVSQPTIVFIRLANPLNLGAPDGIPTRFVFVLLGPPEAAAGHLDTLTTIARLMADEEFRYEAGGAKHQQQLLSALDHYAERTSPAEKTEVKEVSDGLSYSGRLFGGIKQDFARRRPYYLGDFLEGLHSKCAGSTLFLFFACLAPAVTFGGVMAVQTGGQIGAIEMIVASAFCGVVYALLSGQPLIILGGTGPLLVFTAILYRLCNDMEIPFLPSYAWVGLWTTGFLILLAVTEAGCLMRYFTRFTDEIFSALIPQRGFRRDGRHVRRRWSGPRCMEPIVKNVMLASADQVAIDAVAAKLMGFDPMSIKYIRLAHERGLGCGDPRDIEIVGDTDAAKQRWNFRGPSAGTFASRIQHRIHWGKLKRPIEWSLKTVLAPIAYLSSVIYHDSIWYPFVAHRRVSAAMRSDWGRLFHNWETAVADDEGFSHIGSAHGTLDRTGIRGFARAFPLMANALREAPELQRLRRRRAA